MFISLLQAHILSLHVDKRKFDERLHADPVGFFRGKRQFRRRVPPARSLLVKTTASGSEQALLVI
jgi:hypothetical protein